VPKALALSNVDAFYGDSHVLHRVSFELEQGRLLGLLGRNGAGKSTTMRVLAAVVPPTEGRVTVAGHDVAADPMAVRRAVGYCPDVGGLVPRATPWEHLRLSARLRRLEGWEPTAERLLERWDLAGEAHRVTAGFSHGMSRRLSVILASFHEPAVLLLDEPFDGVDPLGVEATLQTIDDARSRGACVLLSTHLRDLAVEACDRALVLRRGERLAEIPAGLLSGDVGAEAYRALLD
jgi:ABC-2 type transport system ATP-binding protein